ncbi:MAG: xylose isomerase [Planctomycetes bacterium GWF2_50_10]|nr:MAG: xylose isomerase [Planctomycetes bacterium GWF2_50_10]
MIKCLGWPIGICSWSINNDLVMLEQIRDITGIDHLHLDINPVIDGAGPEYVKKFQSAGWKFSAAMVGFRQEDYSTLESIKTTGGIVPDECWPQNMQRVFKAIENTGSLGIKFLEFHFGFIDEPGSAGFIKLCRRACLLADRAFESGVILLMETGQETADTLKMFLDHVHHPALAVNFDPGNMILYGKGDPVEAVSKLGKWIRHVHAKDAVASSVPGLWGKEMRWGDGQVDRAGLLKSLRLVGFEGTLSIEREAGSAKLSDIENAAKRLSGYSE